MLWALGLGFLAIRQLQVSRTSVIAFLLPAYLLVGFVEASLGAEGVAFSFEYHGEAPSLIDAGAWAVYFLMLYSIVYCLVARADRGTKSVQTMENVEV